MKHELHNPFRSSEHQLALCNQVIEQCRQSNEPVAELVAALARILSAQLAEECASFP